MRRMYRFYNSQPIFGRLSKRRYCILSQLDIIIFMSLIISLSLNRSFLPRPSTSQLHRVVYFFLHIHDDLGSSSVLPFAMPPLFMVCFSVSLSLALFDLDRVKRSFASCPPG